MSAPPANAASGAISKARPVDARALARISQRLQHAPSAPWLHGEVARRLAEHLSLIKQPPRRVAQWWAHAGASGDVLAHVLPQADIVDVETDALRLAAANTPRPWWARGPLAGISGLGGGKRRPPPVAPGAIEPRSLDMLWANMGLHGVLDVEGQFAQWRRCIAENGFLMFSTLGPGTLDGLRSVYAAAGWGPPMAPLVDMHDLGDMLVHAGYAEPVMDQEMLTLTYGDAAAALAELRGLGGNASRERHAGLRGRAWREALLQALEGLRDASGRIALRFEIVYGHAFCPPPRIRMQGHTEVDLQDMRRMLRQGHPGDGRPAGR